MAPPDGWIVVAKPDSGSHATELGQQSPGTTPALDLTGKITKLEDHYAKAGGFSDVYRCQYTTSEGVKEVAVKAFRFHFGKVAEKDKDEKTSKTNKMIRRELGIWSRLLHPNIVRFMGFVCNFERCGTTSLVSMWMPNGTLDGFCAQYDDQLMLAHRLRLLLDIANGLSHLHSFPIVHGDLSCTNVLIDRNFNACLTDFGLASMIGDIPDALRYLQMTSLRPGAIRWAAPEQLSVDANAAAQRTTKSDIYSFGNLSFLTLSGKHPWSEVEVDMAVTLRLYQGAKPDRPTSRAIEDKHWEFIEYCWSAVDERPQADDVVASLKLFLDSCLPARPLRDFLCIPLDCIEPLGAPSSPHPESKNPKRVRFDDTDRNSPTLPRKPSWHGGIPPGSHLPIHSAPEPKRRRSFDRHSRPQEPASPWPNTLPHFQIHPLLNGEAPRMDLYCDLASPSFKLHPRDHFQAITMFRQYATLPPITRMRITHDSIPQWPIDLEIFHDDRTLPIPHPPITVTDVLYAIHSWLHRKIKHTDWAQLRQYEEDVISHAYTRRCRSVPSSADVEASQGVKRIDYLLDNHIFRGLLKTHDEDGFYCWKLITVTDHEFRRLS